MVERSPIGDESDACSRREFLALACGGVAAPSATEVAVASARHHRSEPQAGFRGVFFNPNVPHAGMEGYPYPVFDPYGPEYRAGLRRALVELVNTTAVNLICVFIPIPFTLARAGIGPNPGQPVEQWGNLTYLRNLALFVDDCHDAGVSVELDLVENRWIPARIDREHHIGRANSGWPIADDTPWEESATWYAEVIRFVESRTRHPEQIAMWSMMGNYSHGAAEPQLWGDDSHPEMLPFTERFVKRVWPAFRAAGTRPKAAPYLLPILSNTPFWTARTPDQRLAGVTNLKKWLVDDLALPPDYWPMTTYRFCDPAPDGFHYLRRIVEILGKENACRIVSTDLKGPGHERELRDSIIRTNGHSGADVLRWHFRKCAEYGFAGWWIWAYQDEAAAERRQGIRGFDGRWKADLVDAIRESSNRRPSR